MPDSQHDDSQEEIRRLRARISELEKAAREREPEQSLDVSSATWDALLAKSPLAVLVWDTDLRIRGWNTAAENIFGYSKEEATGRHFDLIVPEDVAPVVDDVMRKLLQTHESIGGVNENITKDGRRITCRWSNSVMVDQAGQVVGGAAIAEDITQRLETQRQLKESQGLLRTVVDNSPSFIMRIDRQARIRYVNRIEEGYTWDQILNGCIYDSVQPEFVPVMQKAIEKVFEHGGHEEYEVKDVVHGHWFHARLAPVVKDGEIDSIIIIALDIHERRLQEEALRDREEMLRLLTENVPGVVYLCENDRRFTMRFLSDAVSDLVGIDAEDFLADKVSFAELFHPDDEGNVRSGVAQALERREQYRLQYRLRHAEGHYIWVEEYGQGVFDDSGELKYLEGTMYDITQRREDEQNLVQAHSELKTRLSIQDIRLKTAQEIMTGDIERHAILSRELSESERRFEITSDASPVPMVISRISDGKVLYGNSRLLEMFQIESEELANAITTDYYVYPEQRGELFEKLATEGFVRDEELQVRRRDGVVRWVSVSMQPLQFDGEDAVVASFLDVTDRRETAERLQKEQDRLRRMLHLHERDRQLISHDVHDGLAQDIAGVLMHLQAARRNASEESREKINFVIDILRDTHAEARQLINGLQAVTLTEYGIGQAVVELVNDARRNGKLDISLDLDDSLCRFAPALETAVYRVVQESLTNIVRHAKATEASVSIKQKDDWLHVTIRDNGVGFDTAIMRKKRYGLVGVQERARLLEGQSLIESTPGQGTRIHVELPLLDGQRPE